MHINKACTNRNEIILFLLTMAMTSAVAAAATLAITGNTSDFNVEYFPPLELSGDYECALVDFQTYNSVPNVDEKNNLFHIGNEIIALPTVSYEINDIADYINTALHKEGKQIVLVANNNTLKSCITAPEIIYFNRDYSIGSLLGFSKRELPAMIAHTSDLNVNIVKVVTIRIECNIISGSYSNSMRSHILHEFSPIVPPGYKMVEVPRNLIYLPVNVKTISSLTVRIVDQDGDLVNFRGESIAVRVHLKPRYAGL